MDAVHTIKAYSILILSPLIRGHVSFQIFLLKCSRPGASKSKSYASQMDKLDLKSVADRNTFSRKLNIVLRILNYLVLTLRVNYKMQGGSNMTGTNCDLFTHK
jgi:hypothetical protein